MPVKRRRTDAELDPSTRSVPTKKPRRGASSASRDFLSPLSDELLVRILTSLSLSHLLNVAPVSTRFRRLSEDSQIWKSLYYSRFVLPRALRIPGFRDGSAREGKLHYSSRRAVWADGRRGGWVDMRSDDGSRIPRDWKKQYKLRHNWSKGKCAVEELKVGEDMTAIPEEPYERCTKMLVKVCEGIAVTADATSGLRAWDLKTKQLLAQISLADSQSDAPPSCLALDDANLLLHNVEIAVGFCDGSFGVWKLDIRDRRLLKRYRHEKSANGALAGAAFSFPYLLTATKSVLISLYTFDRPSKPTRRHTELDADSETERGSDSETVREGESYTEDEHDQLRASPCKSKSSQPPPAVNLPAPYLLTSLKSHTSRAPLALSIRKTAGTTIASIAYTFSTLQGWSLGIQDLHLKPSFTSSNNTPDITTTRLAYTMPVRTASSHIPSPPTSPARPRARAGGRASDTAEEGPISICYTHPYLLATLPDNTLILYLCTSNASSLSISPGIRLWGHTSGISDAEITARGKAVSVSCRGEEIRVWELEGRAEGRSIEVRPTAPSSQEEGGDGNESLQTNIAFDERRNWVGFDDEMVIVLKESKGTESLMVYDFT
ncbi:F-box protein dre-1 [Seiridium cupressi]